MPCGIAVPLVTLYPGDEFGPGASTEIAAAVARRAVEAGYVAADSQAARAQQSMTSRSNASYQTNSRHDHGRDVDVGTEDRIDSSIAFAKQCALTTPTRKLSTSPS